MSIKDWEHARHPHDKWGPMPGGVRMSPGRSPSGGLRNFHAMGQKKLAHTLRMLAIHGEDHHAHVEAMKAAADKLGVKFDENTIKVPKHLVEGMEELQEFWSEAARMHSAEVRRERAQLRKAGGMTDPGGMASPGTTPSPTPDLHPSVLGGMAAVGQHIRTLRKGGTFSYRLPEGTVQATHTGFGTYHVAGGGHDPDPMARRGDRKISGAGAARREVAERIRSSYAADRVHTDQTVEDAMRHGQAKLTPVGGGQGATVRHNPQGWVAEHPSFPGGSAQFATAHKAVRAAKAAVRADGGRFLHTGEDVDPLHSEAGRLTAGEHLTLARKEAAMDQFEKNFGESWDSGEIKGPRDYIKDHAVEKASDTVSVPGFSDAGGGVPHPGFHHAVSGLIQSHAALMAPHVAAAHAVVSHPAFTHAAHMATQVVQARVDDAERKLEEAERAGDTRKVVAARARVRVARRHMLEAKKQLAAAR